DLAERHVRQCGLNLHRRIALSLEENQLAAMGATDARAGKLIRRLDWTVIFRTAHVHQDTYLPGASSGAESSCSSVSGSSAAASSTARNLLARIASSVARRLNTIGTPFNRRLRTMTRIAPPADSSRGLARIFISMAAANSKAKRKLQMAAKTTGTRG